MINYQFFINSRPGWQRKAPHFGNHFFAGILKRPTEAFKNALQIRFPDKGLQCTAGQRASYFFCNDFEPVAVIIICFVLRPENRVAAACAVFIVELL